MWYVEAWDTRPKDTSLTGLGCYLAGMPTYTVSAEVASSVVLDGAVALRADYPEALTRSGPERWRFHRDFSLTYARREASLGNPVVALGQLARAAVEEAHARHCERGSWVLNEKRILGGVGLAEVIPPGALSDQDLMTVIEEAAHLMTSAR